MSLMKLELTIQGRRLILDIPQRTVFVPNLVGLLNASAISVRFGETVVDAGTGSGVHAILCAQLGAGRVIACDVNADAVKAARRNAELNGVAGRCEFVHGSFEDALRRAGRDIGLVVSTLPNTPTGHRFLREAAMRLTPRVSRHLDGGREDTSLGVRLVREAATRLGRNGRLHLHLVDWSNKDPVRRALREAGLDARVVARAHVPVWGQRCNTTGVFQREASGRPWRLRYRDLPRKLGTEVLVIEAAAGRRPPRRRRSHAITVEVIY